ncbi:MAG: hypothetical protein ACP5U2_08160, partial [Bryobacteraceae bacterium]
MTRTACIPRVPASGRGAGVTPPRTFLVALSLLAVAGAWGQPPSYRLLASWKAGPEVKEVHSLCFDRD